MSIRHTTSCVINAFFVCYFFVVFFLTPNPKINLYKHPHFAGKTVRSIVSMVSGKEDEASGYLNVEREVLPEN